MLLEEAQQIGLIESSTADLFAFSNGRQSKKQKGANKPILPDQAMIEQSILERARACVMIRPKLDSTLPEFIGESDLKKQAEQEAARKAAQNSAVSLLQQLKRTPLDDLEKWRALLEHLQRINGNVLVIAWISEHLITMSLDESQKRLRETAKRQWIRLASNYFNPCYASREDLVHLLEKRALMLAQKAPPTPLFM